MKQFLLYISLIFIVGCHPAVKYVSSEKAGIYINDTIDGASNEVNAIITPYQESLHATMNEVLNTSDIVMERNVPEGILGNFVSDLCMDIANKLERPADFCLLNNGGLRVPIPKGDVTRGKVFELMPFENELVIVELKGKAMTDILNYIGTKNGIPVSKELNIKYKNWQLSEATINKQPFDSTKTYKVLTSDYLARGGDKMDFFSNAESLSYINIKLRDAIIDYIIDEKKAGRTLNASIDGRIINVE